MIYSDSADETTDILIIGAGMAGVCAAHVLSAKGVKVTLVDQRLECVPCFKAEKIEPDQVKLLKKLNVFDIIQPHTARIKQIDVIISERLCETIAIEQYGVHYHEMVNALRKSLPSAVRFICGKVIKVSNSPHIQSAELEDGTQLKAKLLILSSGIYGRLTERLLIKRKSIQKKHSLVFGFDIIPDEDNQFSFDSISYRPKNIFSKVGYISFFWIKKTMRANMFTYWDPKGAEILSFMNNPQQNLQNIFPNLEKVIGKFKVLSKVEAFPIDLNVAEDYIQSGVVLLGDAFQSVCPATGTGLSKLLVDVDRLSQYLPIWLESPGFGVEKIAQFYMDPQKVASDLNSLNVAKNLRQEAINHSLKWRYWRTRDFILSYLRGLMSKSDDAPPYIS